MIVKNSPEQACSEPEHNNYWHPASVAISSAHRVVQFRDKHHQAFSGILLSPKNQLIQLENHSVFILLANTLYKQINTFENQ